MYYRWNESAKNLDAFKKNFAEIGKWYRGTWWEIKEEIPDFYHLVRQGYIDEKPESSSPMQQRNRKFWELEGRTLAVFRQHHLLIEEYKILWPADWNYYHSLTWQMMSVPTKLNYFLNKLREEREANKKRVTGNPVAPDN